MTDPDPGGARVEFDSKHTDPFGLRLAAQASDRARVGLQFRPQFESCLRSRGFTDRSIAQAYAALIGPASVDEALALLSRQDI
jgi:hypothetical protein